MALFQHSVIKKYIQELDKASVKESFVRFTKYFGDPQRQQNIRDSKEEQFQEGFLRSLFVDILGYTLNPEPNFNLLTEQKNEKDSKKADGAILQNGANAPQVIAVIELKGTDTTDLSKVENQAFSYKNNQKGCIYVITSNFEKLRFYIDNAIDFEEFNLFNLSEERFHLLYLCLAKDNLLNGVPQKIKEASVSKEEQITKQLYEDYSAFKRFLFQNITKLNPKFDKLTLFKKTQKLLDRFLFVLFAEDRLLLPPNSIREIVKQWEQLKELDNYIPLYDRFKKYFEYMNIGFKGKKYEVFAYNGGLFAPDELLDKIKIDDTVLHEHTLRLSEYDFDTEVDVNILGHIFEHSLNELEEIQSEIEGIILEKSKTKRKKDGIYYTPKYITKYIVENSIGTLCTEKKKELEINDDEIIISNRKSKKKELIEKIDNYRTWLLKLTICDPACGSGAFLNQALDYLIVEHRKLDVLKARITNSPMIFSDIENSVLENNIFGVDINEDAVEIAKLSLWLKTAQKGRKLSVLSSNIKCGNSLIDDKNIAGDKAFNWQKEFPEIFANGGFNVVIGNPPYVDNRGFNKEELNYLYKNYIHSFKKSGTDKFKTTKLNLIAPFIELNSKILIEKGLTSFIFHKNIFKTNGYTTIREFILKNFDILNLTDWGAGQFQDVVAETATFVLRKGNVLDDLIKIEFYNLSDKYFENQQSQSVFLNSYEFIFGIYSSTSDRNILNKIETKSFHLQEFVNINNGIVTGNDGLYLNKHKENEQYKKAIRGKDIKRYSYLIENEFVLYQKEKLLRARDENIFTAKEKLIMQMININFIITYDENQFYNLGTTYAITNISDSFTNLKYILLILNSKLIGYYYIKKFTNESTLTNAISTQNLFNIPIKKISLSDQHLYIVKADIMLSLNKELQNKVDIFLKRLKSNVTNINLTNKLSSFYELDFKTFLSEIKKQKGSNKDSWVFGLYILKNIWGI